MNLGILLYCDVSPCDMHRELPGILGGFFLNLNPDYIIIISDMWDFRDAKLSKIYPSVDCHIGLKQYITIGSIKTSSANALFSFLMNGACLLYTSVVSPFSESSFFASLVTTTELLVFGFVVVIIMFYKFFRDKQLKNWDLIQREGNIKQMRIYFFTLILES
ncbi:hypothetical protein ACJX0J_032940, partial [Zea mays]